MEFCHLSFRNLPSQLEIYNHEISTNPSNNIHVSSFRSFVNNDIATADKGGLFTLKATFFSNTFVRKKLRDWNCERKTERKRESKRKRDTETEKEKERQSSREKNSKGEHKVRREMELNGKAREKRKIVDFFPNFSPKNFNENKTQPKCQIV